MGIQVVLGIIVSYFPDIQDLLSSLKELKKELEEVCLVENGSDPMIQKELKEILEKNKTLIPKIHWIINPTNIGLASAQNLGIAYGMEKQVPFFLFLDDDSLLTKGSLSSMKDFLQSHSDYGMVAPKLIHLNSNRIQKYPIIHSTGWIYRRPLNEKNDFLGNVSTVIASGSLVRENCFRNLGKMRDDYFIDSIDIEFCLRLRANDWKIAVLQSAVLKHKLGEEKAVKTPLGQIYPTNHSPLRRYYMIRNRIWTWKLYGLKFPLWFLYDIGNFIFDVIRFTLFDKERVKKWKMLGRGIVDGILEKKKRYNIS